MCLAGHSLHGLTKKYCGNLVFEKALAVSCKELIQVGGVFLVSVCLVCLYCASRGGWKSLAWRAPKCHMTRKIWVKLHACYTFHYCMHGFIGAIATRELILLIRISIITCHSHKLDGDMI